MRKKKGYLHWGHDISPAENPYEAGLAFALKLNKKENFIGKEFLRNNKPVIFIEIAPYLYPEFGYNCDELINFIKILGYSFLDEDIKEVSNIFDEVKKIKDGSSKNFFLV